MVKLRGTILISIIQLCLCSCDSTDLTGLVTSPGDNVGKRFEQSLAMEWPEPLETSPDGYTFYVCTDVHIKGTTRNFDRFVDSLNLDPQADFALILGDCIDARGMMPLFASAAGRCSKPLFTALGNHDVFFSQWDDFRKFVGPSVFCFEVRRGTECDLFISLDSASGTLGRKQTAWLKELLAARRAHCSRCIVMTHTNLFKTDNSQTPSGNFPLEETMALCDLFDRFDADIVLQGHDHHREDVTFRGVRYVTVGALKDGFRNPEYLRVRVTAEGLGLGWEHLD